MRLILAALLGLLAGVPAAAANLLLNAGFENGFYTITKGSCCEISGAIAYNWEDNSFQASASGAQITAVYSKLATDPQGGTLAQQIKVGSSDPKSTDPLNGAVQFGQVVTVAGQQNLQLSVWLRGTAGMHVDLVLQRGTAPYEPFAETDISLTGEWQEYKAAGYVADAGAIIFNIVITSPGTVAIDDASMTASQGPPQPPTTAVSKRFFGLHVAGYEAGKMRGSGFEDTYVPVANFGKAKLSGEIAAGWQDNSSYEPVEIVYGKDTANPHSGSADQSVDVVAIPQQQGYAVELGQGLALLPGKDHGYTVSLWVRGDAGMPLAVVMLNANAPYNIYAAQNIQLTAAWTKITVPGIEIGDSGQVFVSIQAQQPGQFYVDDFFVIDDATGKPVDVRVPWPIATVGTLRLWDSGTTWADLEPAKGVWDFSVLDAWVADAIAQGRPDIVLTLGQTPAWASSNKQAVSFYGVGAPAPPANIDDWTDYVGKLAARYKGKIRYWEIWNEPVLGCDPTYSQTCFYSGSAVELAKLGESAAAVLKSVDANNQILYPALPIYSNSVQDDFVDALAQLDEVLEADGGKGAAAADIISVHAYADPPELTTSMLADVRLRMQAHGLAKPLWESEGAAPAADPDLAEGAAILARKYLVDQVSGADRFIWYSWGPAFGPCPPTDTALCVGTEIDSAAALRPSPAAYGLNRLQSWLVGGTITSSRIDDNGSWWLMLKRATGQNAAIVWNPNRTVSETLPTGFTPRQMITLTGTGSVVSGGKVTVTDSPVLLE